MPVAQGSRWNEPIGSPCARSFRGVSVLNSAWPSYQAAHAFSARSSALLGSLACRAPSVMAWAAFFATACCRGAHFDEAEPRPHKEPDGDNERRPDSREDVISSDDDASPTPAPAQRTIRAMSLRPDNMPPQLQSPQTSPIDDTGLRVPSTALNSLQAWNRQRACSSPPIMKVRDEFAAIALPPPAASKAVGGPDVPPTPPTKATQLAQLSGSESTSASLAVHGYASSPGLPPHPRSLRSASAATGRPTVTVASAGTPAIPSQAPAATCDTARQPRGLSIAGPPVCEHEALAI